MLPKQEFLTITEIPDNKIEVRGYTIDISEASGKFSLKGQNTDSEHDMCLGFFVFDESYKGDAETYDTKSKISVEVNQKELVEDAHACMFFKSPNISQADSVFRCYVPVSQSAINIDYVDGGINPAPRKVTIYLLFSKKIRK
jgi:hypothetical protein